VSEITAKAIEKVLKMVKELPPSRFYTLAGILALVALGWVIRTVAELLAAIA